MKKQKTKQASGTGQKREAEEPLPMPTLGLVAEEERFAPLRELLQPVAGTPVNELSEELRGVLRKRAGDDLELLLVSFFAACDARAREIERKRAHVATGEESQGESDASVFFSSCDEDDVTFVVVLAHLSQQSSQTFRSKCLMRGVHVSTRFRRSRS